MSRLTKTMLGLTVINGIASALVLSGVVNVVNFPGFYVVFPLAAIFYGLFLICRMLQKEVAAYDAEERKHHDRTAPENHSHPAEPVHGQEHHEPMKA